jgi:hypothetical protein
MGSCRGFESPHKQIPFEDDRKKGKSNGGRVSFDAHLSDDKTVAKMGHPR